MDGGDVYKEDFFTDLSILFSLANSFICNVANVFHDLK